jgi:hypothetical protein
MSRKNHAKGNNKRELGCRHDADFFQIPNDVSDARQRFPEPYDYRAMAAAGKPSAEAGGDYCGGGHNRIVTLLPA